MQRYFIPTDGWLQNEKVEILDGDHHHIATVMRMKPGDEIICCHPNGRSCLCEIEEINNQLVSCRIVKWLEEHKELPVSVTIAQALPKGDKLDLIVQKGTELGASAFIPFEASRSVVKWDPKKADKKVSRLVKIAKEASEQSHRTKIPEIHSLVSFKQLLQKVRSYKHIIVASEVEAKKDEPVRLSTSIQQMSLGDEVLVVIGPEGGFSEQEMDLLAKEDFQFTRFGPRILRTETAALYFLSVMSYQFEEQR